MLYVLKRMKTQFSDFFVFWKKMLRLLRTWFGKHYQYLTRTSRFEFQSKSIRSLGAERMAKTLPLPRNGDCRGAQALRTRKKKIDKLEIYSSAPNTSSMKNFLEYHFICEYHSMRIHFKKPQNYNVPKTDRMGGRTDHSVREASRNVASHCLALGKAMWLWPCCQFSHYIHFIDLIYTFMNIILQ